LKIYIKVYFFSTNSKGGGGRMKKVLAFVGGVLLLVNTAFAYDAELARDVGRNVIGE
jgi:hypothetical protein